MSSQYKRGAKSFCRVPVSSELGLLYRPGHEETIASETTFDKLVAMASYRVNRPHVVMESFDGEVILVHLEFGTYYSLQGSGEEIWNLIENGLSVEAISGRFVADCEGRAEEIRRSVQNLIDELATEKLIVPVAATEAMVCPEPPSSAAEPRRPFVPPVLERYTDMQDLLLLDPIHDVDESGWPVRKAEEMDGA
jgi:hypothetical protein